MTFNKIQGFISDKINSSTVQSVLSSSQKVEDEETLDQLFSDLDKNGDMKIDLKEFLTLISKVTSACHDAFSVHHSFTRGRDMVVE